MQTDFQVHIRRALAEFAQKNQLTPYPLDSGNGTEYNNHLNGTVFTAYHDRLDDANHGWVEIAIGTDNIATELSLALDVVEAWLKETQSSLRPAQSKSPQWWPRLAVCSLEEVQRFCRAFESLSSASNAARTVALVSAVAPPLQVPPVDERVIREILTRRGQPEFRSALLQAYGGRCTISGCTDIAVLEAAHIAAHSEAQDYRVANGLLLRADLHTLFDLRLVSIDPRSAKVVVSKRLGATYQPFVGCVARLPSDPAFQPDAASLMRHFKFWQAAEEGAG